MKNISIVLNIVLLIAVAILFSLHFSKNQTPEPSKASGKATKASDLSIAYVNSDTLLKKYALFDEMQKSYEDRRTKLQNEFGNQAKGLENEIANFQKTAPSMTQSELKAREENLMMKRQRLMQYQEQLSQQLMREEAQLNDSLYNKISTYIKDFSKKRNYDFVLGYSKGVGIYYAQDSLDITQEVLKGLNEQHKKSGK